MATRIVDPDRDPLGRMLWEYYRGDYDAFLNVWSDTMEMSAMRGRRMFREDGGMDKLERIALAACRGRVLDVGGGSGCHSLALQERGVAVEAIDISPGCVRLMVERGVRSVALGDVLAMEPRDYDTVLMLMNGAGICGSLDGLNSFLQMLDGLLGDSGQLLVDSTEIAAVAATGDVRRGDGGGFTETRFVMIHKGLRSDPFDWLYLDFALLETIAAFHRLRCTKLHADENGRFLARIQR